MRNLWPTLAILSILLVLGKASKMQAATFEAAYASSSQWANISLNPGQHTFRITGVPSSLETRWRKSVGGGVLHTNWSLITYTAVFDVTINHGDTEVVADFFQRSGSKAYSHQRGWNISTAGRFRVTIEPAAARSAGAQWRLANGPSGTTQWFSSGHETTALSGNYTLQYSSVSGWNVPSNHSVSVNVNATAAGSITGTYSQQVGSVTATLQPEAARNAGARWKLTASGYDSGWLTSGQSVQRPIGAHQIQYNSVSGWNSPANESITVANNQTVNRTGTYVQQTGSVSVTINPAAANTAGAQWRLIQGSTYDSGWRNSGQSVTALVGSYTISFRTISGWNRPADISVSVTNGSSLTRTGTYEQVTSSLTATLANVTGSPIQPANVEWRVGSSGIVTGNPRTFTGLTAGNLSVEAWQNGSTPWGNEKWYDATFSMPGSNTSQTFRRNMPISKGHTTIRRQDGTEVELGTPLIPGQPHTLRIRVINPTGGASRNVRAGVRMGRTQTMTSADFSGTTANASLAANGEVVLDFNFTPTTAGSYHLTTSIESLLNANWVMTDSDPWAVAFSIPTSSLTATLANVTGSPIQPDNVEWRVGSSGIVTGNPRTFTGLTAGNLSVEAWQNGSTPWGNEKWYDTTYSMPSSSTLQTFRRNLPISKGHTTIRRQDGTEVELGTPLILGQPHTLRIRVINPTGGAPLNVRAGVRIGQTQNMATAEFSGTTASASLAANGEVVLDFNFTPTTAGAYQFTTSIDSLLNANWVITDSEPWSSAFSVVAEPELKIVGFTVPPGSPLTVRGGNLSATVRVRNTTGTARGGWVGLSFRNQKYLGQAGQVGWYDIQPKQVQPLPVGGEVDVVFTFPVNENLEPGQFFASAKTWNSFNQDVFLMEGELDSTENYLVWNLGGNGSASFTLGNYVLNAGTPESQLLNLVAQLMPSSPDLTAAYNDREKPWKPLLVIKGKFSTSQLVTGGILKVNVFDPEIALSLVIDLADYLQISPEGKEGRVSVWLDQDVSIGLGFGVGKPVEVGIIPYEFHHSTLAYVDQRVEKTFTLTGGANAHVPFFSVYLLSPDNGNFRFVPNGTIKLGASLSIAGNFGAQGIVSAEVPREVLEHVFSPGYGVLNGLQMIDTMFERFNTASVGKDWSFTLHDGAKHLFNGVSETGISIAQNPNDSTLETSALFYRLSIAEHVQRLTIQTTPGANATGSAHLFARRGGLPTLNDAIRSVTAGLSHSLIIDDPEPGDWFVRVNGAHNFTDLNLRYFVTGGDPGAPPSITSHPANQSVIAPNAATFSVTATGTAPLSYQWQRSTNGGSTWSNLSGATGSTYNTGATTTAMDGHRFRCVVSNGVSPDATSNAAILAVSTAPIPPSITSHPANQSVIAPNGATFSVTATGTAPLSYQWQRSTNGGSTWSNLSGAAGSTYNTGTTTTAMDGHRFRCVVSNGVSPDATSNAAILAVSTAPVPPSITSHPANQSVIAPNGATFSVTATGTAPLSYQWQRSTNGGSTWSNLSGATGSTYNTGATTTAMDGHRFRCVVSNGVLPDATSNAATLAVSAAPIQVAPLYHFTFDETLAETKGRLGNVTTSGLTSYIDGPRGKALRLDDLGSHGLLPAVDFSAMSATTVAFWVREEALSSHGTYYVFWGDERETQKHLGVGHLQDYLGFGPGTAWVWFDSEWSNEWVHFAVVHTETTSTLYVNGVKVKEVDQVGAKWKSTGTGYLGGHRNTQFGTFTARFKGAIDDLMVFDNALTDNQVMALAEVLPSLVLSPVSRQHQSSAETAQTIAVSAVNAWTASVTEGSGWISLTAGQTGQGNGEIVYAVSGNTMSLEREGVISVTSGGEEVLFRITQSGAPATLAINPTTRTQSSTAVTNRSITVTSNTEWAAVAASGSEWLTITSGSAEVGNGTVRYNIAANPSFTTRTGTIVVSGGGLERTHTVSQSGQTVTLTLNPASRVHGMSATAAQEVNVTCNTDWTAAVVDGAEWLALAAASAGSGNGLVTYMLTENTSGTDRNGVIRVTAASTSRDFLVKQIAEEFTPHPDLLLHLPLNGDAIDMSGKGQSVTTSNITFGEDRFGNPSGAVFFNNTTATGNARITVGHRNELNSVAYTLAMWVKPSSSGYNSHQDWAVVLRKGTSYPYGMFLDKNNLKASTGVYHAQAGTGDGIWSPTSLQLNEWHHLAATYQSGVCKLYVNGVMVAETNQAGGLPANTESISIGSGSFSAISSAYQGWMDDIKLYSSVLSESEIEMLAGVSDQPRYAYFLSNESGNAQLWRGELGEGGITNRQQLTQVPAPGRVEFFKLDIPRNRIGLITFSGTQNADGRFFWMNPDGSGMTQVSDFAASGPFSISPDGTQVVVARGVNSAGGNVNEAYFMDSSSGTTSLMLSGSQPRDTATHKTWFEWLPNGKILFSDTRVWSDYAGQHDIHLWDSGTVTPLATNTAQGDATPLLSPDGTKLLVSHYAAGGGTHQISYIQWPADTGRTVILPWSNQGPSANGWLDNETVLFHEAGELYSMALDGTGRTNLTNTSGVNEFYLQVWPGTTPTSSSNADLSNLALSSGTLSPAFSSATTSYTTSVANAVSSITVTPTAAQANATIAVRINGGSYASVTSGSPSGALALNVGGNAVDVRVTAQDGTTIKTYSVTVTRAAPLSSNADLSNLALSAGSLNPAFSSTTTTYTASVANAVSSITVTPTAAQTNATIAVRINGSSYANVTSGSASGALALNVGGNTVDVRVTAQDGTTIKTYSVTVTRAAAITPPTVTTPTAASVTATGATLGGNVTSDGGSAITERGVVYSVTAMNSNPVIGGSGVVKVATTGTTGVFTGAVTGLTQGTGYSYKAFATNSSGTSYTSTGTFTTFSTNADLSSLALSSGTLSPAFASGTISYTASVANTVSSITVTPTRAHSGASIQVRVNSGSWSNVASGSPSGPLALNVGSNTVDVRVTAQAGNTRTYTVTVTRSAALVAPTVTSPTATIVTATGATLGGNVTSDGGAAITERGVVYSITSTNNNPLIGGTGVTKLAITGTTGVFTVPVTGLTQGTGYSYRAYAINSQGTSYTSVTAFTTPSTNADLSQLVLSAGSLSPIFTPATTTYSASVANAVSSITVTPTAAQVNATIAVRVNGSSYGSITSGSASGALALNVGGNTVDVRVTAQDGTTIKTYNVTVTRADPLSNNADLSNLALSSGALNPAFSSATIGYTASVANAVGSITVTPTAAQANATIAVRVNGGSFTNVNSGSASGALALNVGSNTVEVRTTAQNGTSIKTYTVTVTRAAPTNAPAWQTPTGLENSMTLYARVENLGAPIEQTGSLLAVFQGGLVAGVAAFDDGPTGRLFQVTVWSNQSSVDGLSMKVYDAGAEQILDIQQTLDFRVNQLAGAINNPLLLTVRPPVVEQQLPLVSGWNWLSFNAVGEGAPVGQALGAYTPQDGDIIKGTAGSSTFFDGGWFPPAFPLEPGRMYMLRRQQSSAATLSVTGPPSDPARPISLVNGWNWLGFIPQTARPLIGALSQVTVANGNVIKSQQDGSVTYFDGSWFPVGRQMHPGRGYLLQVNQPHSFAYDAAAGDPPLAPQGAPLAMAGLMEEAAEPPQAIGPGWQSPMGLEHSMTLYASIRRDGSPVEAAGSLLAVFDGEDLAGVAEIIDGPAGKLYQVTVWSNATAKPGMRLRVYDAATDEILAVQGTVNFTTNALIGSINAPLVFSVPGVSLGGANAPEGAELARLVSGQFQQINLVPGWSTRFLSAVPNAEEATGTFSSNTGSGRNRVTVSGNWTYLRTGPDTAEMVFSYLYRGSSYREDYQLNFTSWELVEGSFEERENGVLIDSGRFSFSLAGRPTRVEEDLVSSGTLPTRVGEQVALRVAGDAIPAGATVLGVTGLPRGLRYDRGTNQILGHATASGVWLVTVRYRDTAGTVGTAQFQIQVEALPVHAVGTSIAMVEHSDLGDQLCGLVTATVTSTGAASGRVRVGSWTHSFRGAISHSSDNEPVRLAAAIQRGAMGSLNLLLHLSDDHRVAGRLAAAEGGADLTGWRQTWHARNAPVMAGRVGRINTLLGLHGDHVGDGTIPQGSGHAGIMVTTAGQIRWVGRLADNTAITQALPLGPNGEVGLALPLYRGTGSVQALALLTDGGNLGGVGSWVRLPQTRRGERSYAGGFGFDLDDGPVRLNVTGAKWVRGVSALQPGGLEFSAGGLEESAADSPNIGFSVDPRGRVVFDAINPARVRFTWNATLGMGSGSFVLTDDNPENPGRPLSRTVTFQSLVVPGATPQGGGFFLLDQLADPPLTSRQTSPRLSGLVEIR
jgi:spore germination protein GerM